MIESSLCTVESAAAPLLALVQVLDMESRCRVASTAHHKFHIPTEFFNSVEWGLNGESLQEIPPVERGHSLIRAWEIVRCLNRVGSVQGVCEQYATLTREMVEFGLAEALSDPEHVYRSIERYEQHRKDVGHEQ